MGGFYLFLVICACLKYFIEYLPEILGELGKVIGFLGLCLWEVAKPLGRGLLWLAVHGGRGAYWAGSNGALFAFILIDEWRRSTPEDGQQEECAGEEQDLEPARDAYALALDLLGLSDPFTSGELKRVYRQAMKAAHPDAGGINNAAQELNAARDLIMKVKGWK